MTAIDHAARRDRLAAGLAAAGAAALLVTRAEHVRWLTGFTGSNAALLLDASGAAAIATDSRYTTQVAEQAPDLRCVTARDCPPALLADYRDGAAWPGRAADPGAPARVGFEADWLSFAAASALREAAGGLGLEPTRGLVEDLRLVKEPAELDLLRRAAGVAVGAYRDLLASGGIAAGRTEREVAADLEHRMRLRGADRPSFDTIVASGPNSALPHHGAADRVLAPGDLVTIDFGALVDGYCSDMTRTTAVGGAEAADDFAREIHSVVLRAQLAGLAAARPGTGLREVDAACREVIAAAGWGEYFVHSTGHGIGVDVHEPPFASTRGHGALAEGMTLTVEPGVYVPGRGGVRIEDTVIITSGEPENLVDLPKTL